MEQPDSTTFIDQLERTPEPRRAGGRSFEWRILLAIISATLVSGLTTPRGIAHWALGTWASLVGPVAATQAPATGRLDALSGATPGEPPPVGSASGRT
jgi:hypothetical protein